MIISLLLALLFYLLPQPAGPQSVETGDPFYLRVDFTASATANDAKIYIVANWAKLEATELAIVNERADVVRVFKKIPAKGQRISFRLADLFSPDQLSPGQIDLRVSVRAENGDRAEVRFRVRLE